MISEFHGSRVRQCRQAEKAFHLSQCCLANGELYLSGGGCDKEWYPEFNDWGFGFEFVPNACHTSEALTWDELKTEIDERRPFLFGWIESPPITHMLVGVGYSEVDGDRRVFYRDPLVQDTTEEPIVISFSQYKGTSEFQHQFDYYGILPRSTQ